MTDKENEEIEITEDAAIVAEEAAFNAAVDSLIPESTDPLGSAFDEKTDEELDKEADDVVAAAEHFLGDMTAEQVLEKLGQIDGMEEALYEKVSQKVFGKFGEIGQSLKALQEREFTFDPDKLEKLKELDEGIAGALAEDLKNALKGQSFDSDAIVADMKKSIMGDLNPYMEQRLLTALVPDIDQIVKSDEFSKWFFDEAKQEVRDLFQAWDERTQMDGVGMAKAFGEFNSWKEGLKTKAKSKEESLNKSVEDTKADSKTPAARRTMSEDEAFSARLKETSG